MVEAYSRDVLHLLTSFRGQSRGATAASAAIASAFATSAMPGPVAQKLAAGNGLTGDGLGSGSTHDRAAGAGVGSLGKGNGPPVTAVGSSREDERLKIKVGESLAREYPAAIGEAVTVCGASALVCSPPLVPTLSSSLAVDRLQACGRGGNSKGEGGCVRGLSRA